MNYFQSHGLETWRCHDSLPGAKTEVLASVRLFSSEKGPLLKVLYSQLPARVRPLSLNSSTASSPVQPDPQLVSMSSPQGSVETLLNQFCRAIEVVGQCNSCSIPLSVAKESMGVPWLILGDDLAAEIPGQIDTSHSPQAVLAAPELKAVWWALVRKALTIA